MTYTAENDTTRRLNAMRSASIEFRMALAIVEAEELGHNVVCDGVGIRRFTCTKLGCGRALLAPHAVIYGSALTEPCDGLETTA